MTDEQLTKILEAIDHKQEEKGSDLNMAELTSLVKEVMPVMVTMAMVRAITSMLSGAFH